MQKVPPGGHVVLNKCAVFYFKHWYTAIRLVFRSVIRKVGCKECSIKMHPLKCGSGTSKDVIAVFKLDRLERVTAVEAFYS